MTRSEVPLGTGLKILVDQEAQAVELAEQDLLLGVSMAVLALGSKATQKM